MLACPERNRRAITAGLAATVLLLTACQSTARQTTDDNAAAAVYPGGDSPGLTDTTITVALPGISDSTSQLWKYYGPVYMALKNLVDARNEDGGIAGRTITPIWENDALTGDQAAAEVVKHLCALSVGENSSFARQAASASEYLTVLKEADCVGPARTINFILDTMVSADVLEDTPDVVAPNALDDVTAAHMLVDRLSEQGFFDGAERVAVLSPGGTWAETAKSVLVDDLEAAGVENPLVLAGTAGTELTEAGGNSLVLQMKSENIDRIVYFDDWHYSSAVIPAMVKQKYTPPIGTLSSAKPDYNLIWGYPAEQISAVSWLAGFALGEDGAATLATLPDSPASRACVALPESAGLKIALNTEEFLLSGCNILALLDEAFEASGAEEPSTAAFFTGLAELADFDSAYGFTLDFSHGRAGASQVWDLEGDAACNCLKITGGPYPIERD